MSKVLNVMECIGTPSAITQELGDILYREIVKSIEAKEVIELDFSDVESMISPFLNNSIGKLYGKYNGETLTQYLKISNLPKEKIATVNMVIQNAKRFYSNQKEFEKIVKDVVN